MIRCSILPLAINSSVSGKKPARWISCLPGWQAGMRIIADTLTQTLEPLLLVIVGGLVGTLVIAMYLPIFQLGNVLAGA